MIVTRHRSLTECLRDYLFGLIPILVITPMVILLFSLDVKYGLIGLSIWMFVSLPIIPTYRIHFDAWRHDLNWTVAMINDAYTIQYNGEVIVMFQKEEIERIEYYRAIPFSDKESELAYLNYFIAQVTISHKGTITMTSMSFDRVMDFKELFPMIAISYRVSYWLAPMLSCPYWQEFPSKGALDVG